MSREDHIYCFFCSVPIRTLPFQAFRRIPEAMRDEWRNSTPRFTSLPKRGHVCLISSNVNLRCESPEVLIYLLNFLIFLKCRFLARSWFIYFIWSCDNFKLIYIFIFFPALGFNCVITINTKIVNSGLRGTTQALIILAAYSKNRYEFIFTNLSSNCVRHYTTVTGIYK